MGPGHNSLYEDNAQTLRYVGTPINANVYGQHSIYFQGLGIIEWVWSEILI